MKLKEYNQMMAYLTRPRDSLRKIIKKKKDNSNYMVANGTFKTENQIKEEEVNKDPNILRRIKYYTETYDNAKVGKEFDIAIAEEDKNLKKLRGKNIMQRNKPIRPIKKKPTDPVRPDCIEGIVKGLQKGLKNKKVNKRRNNIFNRSRKPGDLNVVTGIPGFGLDR